MTAGGRVVVILALLTAGCETATRPSAFVIPGPAVPSVPTAAPYVWDTRDELAIWVENSVSRGNIALDGSGAEGRIRITDATEGWTLRGPDLAPAATGVRTLGMRFRWQPDPTLSPVAARDFIATAYFETTAPLQPFYHGQGAASGTFKPQTEWTDITLTPGQFTPPIDVLYTYLVCSGANRGVLEIDRIELVR